MTRQQSFILGVLVSCFIDPKALLLGILTLSLVLFGPQLFAFSDGSASASVSSAVSSSTASTASTALTASNIFKQFINHNKFRELIELFQKKS